MGLLSENILVMKDQMRYKNLEWKWKKKISLNKPASLQTIIHKEHMLRNKLNAALCEHNNV